MGNLLKVVLAVLVIGGIEKAMNWDNANEKFSFEISMSILMGAWIIAG